MKNKDRKKEDKYSSAGDRQIIKRLRIKFCAIMMLIVVAFLAVVFTVQYLSNKRTMDEQSENALQKAIERVDGNKRGGFNGQNPDDFINPDNSQFPGDFINPDNTQLPGDFINPDNTQLPEDFQNPDRMEGFPDFRNRDSMDGILTTPVMCVIIDADGEMTVSRNDIFFIADEDAETLVKAAEAEGGSKGILNDYKIRFMKKTLEDGRTAMAFADISTSMTLLSNQLVRSIWISLGVTAAMFVLSLFISKWAVHPVETALRNQKRFVADASHELKTPLAVIISNTDMVLKSEGIDGKNKRRLDNVKAESARMKELVQELIDLARGDSTDDKPAMEEIDLSSLISDDLLSWDPVAYDAGRSISDDIEEGICVKGNRDKLKQLLGILIDNAIKYSDEGSEIKVSLKKSDKKAVLSVKDQGKALTEEEKARVFDRFYRADESRESTSGYGLGLSIAAQIAALHKGRIYVDTKTSKDGKEFNIFKFELQM